MTAPVIGISAYADHARWGVWDTRATLLPQEYVDAVAAAGAVPVLLPPVANTAGAVPALDGLLLAGGGDIAPARYGAPVGERTAGVQDFRDAAESALLAAALGRGIPVLGICRGMQLLNVARGGTLHQHLPDVVGHDGHRLRLGVFDPHPVTVAEGSRTARALGRTRLEVPSYHHQAVAEPGAGVTATAWADDGTVEAIEYDDTDAVLGVQWHPEMGADPSLFAWLTAGASAGDRVPSR
ncbi:gamma-glutamyl-gamma-aminobutyrate hydrolase family protein [Nocardiopsis lambiniae]|uniref:Gamma-glutamyl-gamma-aminobutyrate hydrolase family protein n=1 Tax=Nocardiopsis lambiniae TaxID=3075539 RepID=A0ABU2ME57_9ACTN|nr:gamma-glutamyl-gamma-aminobutyrate hydrolase family protein [Nocardiopsis sp. DSM 44743]MDT0330566.1 gamma-glutamyl-gamma-aminobutyrate hydrolase family protein [Nocardiopsis sp. DSM 44743]